MREALTESTSWTKPDLLAAVAAVDTWVDDNATAYNSALPLAFRTEATAVQKAALLGYVIWRRIGKLSVTED
jgi:hypothetical protein